MSSSSSQLPTTISPNLVGDVSSVTEDFFEEGDVEEINEMVQVWGLQAHMGLSVCSGGPAHSWRGVRIPLELPRPLDEAAWEDDYGHIFHHQVSSGHKQWVPPGE